MADLVLLLAVVAGGYLIGAVPFGYLVARARGIDIFTAGSGNIGATNVGRVLGRKFGVLVFVLDALKGALPTVIGLLVGQAGMSASTAGATSLPADVLGVAAGMAAFIGHL